MYRQKKSRPAIWPGFFEELLLDLLKLRSGFVRMLPTELRIERLFSDVFGDFSAELPFRGVWLFARTAAFDEIQ